MKCILAAIVILLSVAACTRSSPAAPATSQPTIRAAAATVAEASGSALPAANELCRLITPADWSAAGLTGAQNPTIDSHGAGAAYCAYTPAAGAQGGLELDAFVDLAVSNALDTFQAMNSELSGGQIVSVPRADEALIDANVDGTYGALDVRSGRFSFSIAVPASSRSEAQLMSLASLVLARGQAYR